MAAATPWTTGRDLKRQAERLWERGLLGRAVIDAAVAAPTPDDDAAVFPLRLTLKKPSSAELGNRFDEARAWIAEIGGVAGVRIETRQVNHRLLGENEIPARAWIDRLDDALQLAGVAADAKRLHQMAVIAEHRQPSALAVLRRRPAAMVAQFDVWGPLLDLVDWIELHPAPGLYLRQIDLPGIDTKFIETHRSVLTELIDTVVPAAIIEEETSGSQRFERRYGFRTRPNLIRFRILDPDLQLPGLGLGSDPATAIPADITLDATSFSRLELDARIDTAFLVENETNFLAFPPRAGSLVIWGGGYGTERFEAARWLDLLALHYWGDIDTHGFAILDELRRRFPGIESLLMDRQTLLDHRASWGAEPRQVHRVLPRLTDDETDLYDDLHQNRLGSNVRLEQERVAFNRLEAVIER
ncbi:MAG: Wadjet anti-phage system protein JetD domain-containing protein [Actinomycetota bacterium]